MNRERLMADADTVYIIDDDTALRTAYSMELRKLGYIVETASDGVEGQKLVKEAKPALILLDMLMPNLDGMSFLRELRADKANDAIKVVVTSNFEATPDSQDLNV